MTKFKSGVALGMISSVALLYASNCLKKKGKIEKVLDAFIDKIKK